MKRLVSILTAIVIVTQIVTAAEVRDELGLREFLLNEELKSAHTNEICYISFGSRPDTNLTQRVWTTNDSDYDVMLTCLASPRALHTDPPADFLTRFAGRHFVVKPASQYPKSKADREKNPKTGVPDGLYTVEILEWIDNTTAKVRCSIHRAFLWATGYETIVETKDGKWRFKEFINPWIS